MPASGSFFATKGRRASYAPLPFESGVEAGTARLRAHSRKAWISSLRVVERGTVPISAAAKCWVVSSCCCA